MGSEYRVERFDTQPLQSIRPCVVLQNITWPHLTSTGKTVYFKLSIVPAFKLDACFPYVASHFTIQVDPQHMFALRLHSFAHAITNGFPLCSNERTYIIAQGQRNVVNKQTNEKKKSSSITFIRWQLARERMWFAANLECMRVSVKDAAIFIVVPL